MHQRTSLDKSGASPTIQLIYIAGAGRSGSTLLSNILGQLPGAVSVGELYYLWERGLEDNILCGCGTPVRECAFWMRVLERTRELSGVQNVKAVLRAGVKNTRTRHMLWLQTGAGRRRFVSRSQPFIYLLQSMYRAIAEQTGCASIIDASKFPTYCYLLTQTPNIDVTVVHLIRDARAVGFSWQRRKYNPDADGLFGRMSTGRSALIWDVWNIGAEMMRRFSPSERYYRLRYETFVEQPEQALGDIIRVAGLDARPENVITDGMVTMRQGHTIGGNPVRFERSMRLRLDTEWQRVMPTTKWALTTALTWPLLNRYRYQLGRSTT